MSLLSRISARTVDRRAEARSTIDTWLDQYLLPANQFSYNGTTYPFGLNTTWAQSRQKEIANSLPGYLGALRGCPPAFAAQMVRAVVLSQARFTFRSLPSQPNARKMFGTRALGVLEKPWPRATTGQLIARMEWHAGLAGNAYVYRQPDRLRVLRPDWVSILFGSQREPDDPLHALDGEVIGYVYVNGGIGSPTGKPQTLLPDEVAHWSPQPDPERAEIGMSWITPALRDIQADQAATEHKIQFFAHGATPNLVVKGIPAATKEQFTEIVDAMEDRHAGVMNAYRTLYLTAGADATVVGANLSEINIGGVQGASETRISFLSRVPAALLGIQDGMKGSSLNAGNYAETRRTFSDSWIYPTLQDLCASLAPMLEVPAGAELWFDPADMPILREDSKDAAAIEQVKMVTITGYVKEGFTADSSIAAVRGQDITLLKHTGMVSVQLQPPGSTPPDASAPAPPNLTRSADDELDEETLALIAAFEELEREEQRAFDPAKHPRNPKGTPGGGRFRSLVDRLKDAITEHHKSDGKGDPFEGYSREQLRRTAKARGIELKRGESRDDIAKKLLDHLGGGKPQGETVAPKRSFKSRAAAAAKGNKALDAVPLDLMKPWSTGMSKEQADALYEYRVNDYLDINEALRFGGGTLAPEDARLGPSIAAIDSAMAQSKTDRDVLVMRGIENGGKVFGPAWHDNLVGAEWSEYAYVSTTASADTAHDFASKGSYNNAVMRIVVPEGTGAVQLSGKEYESELLLERGLRLRVVSDSGEARAGSIRTLEVEVVPAWTDQSGSPTTASGRRTASPWTTPSPLNGPTGSLDRRSPSQRAEPGEPQAARAAGHDTTPGHDELHHYWTVGAGREKWVHSPKPWTTLVALLTPHVGPEKAKVYASRWFIEVKGYAAGSDLNRVAHGKPPRGNKIGPG